MTVRSIKNTPSRIPHGSITSLTIAAMGIVYGDIGTSPLYALNQIFFGAGEIAPTSENVLGCLSLVTWTLTIIVAIKYAILVVRAENDGEGGVFALYALLHKYRERGTRLLLWALILGAGLLVGDGMITPAISVLSAVEGLNVATPQFTPIIVPATVVLLTALFSVQFKGTSGIGKVFGPILGLWFLSIAIFGGIQIVQHPNILSALNPVYGIIFLIHTHSFKALIILGALMLVVTGGEAMYADLGHFGLKPIRVSWFSVVFPSLLLNYLGQGAFIMGGGTVVGKNIFYSIVPHAFLLPMVILATVATIIASQALISGAFSLTAQSIALGLFPRLRVTHTHHHHAGQIYIPFVNWTLYIGCVALVFTFGSSSALASAYGLAVSGVMVITSLAMFPVARLYWNWGRTKTITVWGIFTFINAAFLLANSLKFLEGGFVPFTVGVGVFAIMATWRWGRDATFAAYSSKSHMTVGQIVTLHRSAHYFIERNALVMAPKPLRHKTDLAPALMSLLWERSGILPRNLIFLDVIHPKIPYIHDERCKITVFDQDQVRGSVMSVELSFGFMEEPNVEAVLKQMAQHHEIDLPHDPHQWVIHVALENLLPSSTMGYFSRLRLKLFIFLRLLSRPTYYAYGLGDGMQLVADIFSVRVR